MTSYYDEWSKLTPVQQMRVFQIENEQSYDSVNDIRCPYCNTVQHSIEHSDANYDLERESRYVCDYPDCGKEFTVIADVSYTWSTQVPQEEALEIFKQEIAGGSDD